MSGGFTRAEVCVVALAECFRGDGEIVANPIGTIPMIAGRLARATFEPDLMATDGEAALIANDEAFAWPGGRVVEYYNPYRSMFDVVWSGRRHVVMGATQIDPYGNLNTTVIGPWESPTVRLPGSGGGADVASFAWRTIIVMAQDRRKFTPRLDFMTSPGYLTGPGAREAHGLPAGTGPYRVVTQLGVYGFDPGTLRMELLSAFEGVRVPEDIQAASGFEIPISRQFRREGDPTAEELAAMHALDPAGVVLGG